MKVPISFEFKGKPFKGYFRQVSGAAGVWHLMSEDHYYYGQLILNSQGWQWSSNTKDFTGMDDFFGDYLTAYLQ